MRAALVLSIALAIGCRDQQLARLEGIRDEVCACKTSACAETAMARVPQDKVEPTQRSQKVARTMLDCLARLYTSERPVTGPDTETEDSAPGDEAGDSPPAPTAPPAAATPPAAPTPPTGSPATP